MGNCARVSKTGKDPIVHAPIKAPPSPPANPSNISNQSPLPQNDHKSQQKSEYHNDLGVLNLMSHIGYTNNCEYKGELSKNKQRHGKGTLKWPDGTIYSGDWIEDRATGKGLLKFPNGDTYEGDFVENKFEGVGKYVNSKGVAYEGEWQENVQSGKGIETFADGTYFEGEYVNGQKNGPGKISFADGSVYEGNFVANNIEGRGTLVWPATENKVYEGEWKNNMMEGKGKMTWLDTGKTYEGSYKEDKKNGLGAFSWGNGEKWIGYWKDGVRHGKGVLIDKTNKVIERGDWSMGKNITEVGFGGSHKEDNKGYEEIFDYIMRNSS